MTGAMGTEPRRATFRVPDDIAWIDGTDVGVDEELYLTKVPGGQTVLLAGTARLIWLVAADGREVLSGVAEIVGVEPAQIEDDVTRFLADLVSRGLLTREERG